MTNIITQKSLLLRLPLEIRVIIYEYLLFPSIIPSSSLSTCITQVLPDHSYYSGDANDSPFTLAVRTINPYLEEHTSKSWRKRSTYYVRAGPSLTTPTPTTYRVLFTPHTAHFRHTIPSLLPLCRQVHFEASRILYSTYTFDFHTSIEAAVPFLSDLTPLSRSYIRSIGVTKKGFPYTKEFDRAEWSALCEYLSSHISLHNLNLSVAAGRPGEKGWEGIKPITAGDFESLHRMKQEWGTEVGGMDLDWVQQLFTVKGLKDVNVRALVELCPGIVSETMTFWVAFSASVEGGFREWVRNTMVCEA